METVKIVSATIDDYDQYYSIRCDSTDIYWMGHTCKPDYKMLRSIYNDRLDSIIMKSIGMKQIMMIEKDTEAIGFIMLSNNKDGIEIGISVKEAFQGQGIGSLVIRKIVDYSQHFNKELYARIRDDNIASQKAFLSNGFKRTEEYEIKKYPLVGNIAFRKYIYKS